MLVEIIQLVKYTVFNVYYKGECVGKAMVQVQEAIKTTLFEKGHSQIAWQPLTHLSLISFSHLLSFYFFSFKKTKCDSDKTYTLVPSKTLPSSYLTWPKSEWRGKELDIAATQRH